MRSATAALLCVALAAPLMATDPWLSFQGKEGVGAGKHVVLVSGDEEYRSEQSLPQLARILSERHGFRCTVLFAIDPADGTVSPNVNDNIPGLEQLASADLMIIQTRWRNLPDEQMKPVVDYLNAGKPVVGLRTATHAFKFSGGAYQNLSDGSKAAGYEGGFGRLVLGEQWVAHHGAHGKQGTRGVVAPTQEGHAILKGIEPGSIFGTTDVYTVKPLPEGSEVLVLGEVTETLEPDSKPLAGPKNSPMMPVAWTKPYALPGGKSGRAFTTTMGGSEDLAHEGTRRLIVNGALWALGLEEHIPAKTDVALIGDYKPTRFKSIKTPEWKPGKPPAAYDPLGH